MSFRKQEAWTIALCALLALDHAAYAAVEGDWKVLVHPSNSFQFNVLARETPVLQIGAAGWGPGWNPWIGISSDAKATGDELAISAPMEIGGQKPAISLDLKAAGPRRVVFHYTLSAARELPILQIIASIGVPSGSKCNALLTRADGSKKSTELPMNPSDFGLVKKIALTGSAWTGAVEITLDPPLEVNGDGDLRIRLAAGRLREGTTQANSIWSFPAPASLLLKQSDVLGYAPTVPRPDWFAYEPAGDVGKSVLGAEDWLDRPAGKHGGVRIQRDRFVFEDGTPIQFWGVNLSYGASAPPREDAQYTAARFARFGVNAVRMHKFTGPGWEGIGDENVSTRMKPEGLDRLDYFASQLARRGVYYGWSHTFRFKIRPGDRLRVSGFDELMKKGGNTYAVINWAEDVQDLLIESVVNLLQHENPYTGKTYAQDPTLCYIELQNEDDIFFWTSSGAYNDFPTYRKQIETRFAQWLRERYGTQEKLAAAWKEALGSGEELAASAITLEMNPWPMTEGGLPRAGGGMRQRMLDNAAFLHATQNRFYSKFVKAIRDAGYKGPLVGSPWQAPAMLPHYYNLRSDDLVGAIDRHNYFGETFVDTMLQTPGGGYLSSGLQQVAGKPFGVSEWIHVYPSLYSAEGPVLVAAYGMGLLGWGASYEFQSTSARIDWTRAIAGNQPFGVWNADAPTQLGQYPILARMILRGDLKRAPIISTRRVSPENLATGEFDFADTVRQQRDIKTFTGSVPAEALAAGRAVVEFIDHSSPSTFPDMSKFKRGAAITSATGQLRWDTAGGGMVTIDAPGTQGFVGFAHGKQLSFRNVQIEPSSPYASILITAADPHSSLADDDRVLISAVARNANKGFRILTLDNRTIVDNGTPPVMLEPVKAGIRFVGRSIARVNVLDQDGRHRGQTLPVQGDGFKIDTARDRTLYYEVVFDR